MQRAELETYLHETLEVGRFRDYCPNGLQVEGRAEVRSIVTGVTASLDLLNAARDHKADAVFVHHGYFWRGEEPHEQLHRRYAEADAFVFASSCENMPNILVEAMAAGLPIACSNRGPMPEVLGDAGVYFDPDSADAIATAIHELMIDVRGRARYAEAAALAAKAYSWDRCASDTFRFIREIYDTHRQSQ